MAGSSALTIHRSEDATVLLQFQTRLAARTFPADLSDGVFSVQITAYPTEQTVLSLSADDVRVGASLTVTDPSSGRAVLFVAKEVWGDTRSSRCLVRGTLSIGGSSHRLGEQIIELTD